MKKDKLFYAENRTYQQGYDDGTYDGEQKASIAFLIVLLVLVLVGICLFEASICKRWDDYIDRTSVQERELYD